MPPAAPHFTKKHLLNALTHLQVKPTHLHPHPWAWPHQRPHPPTHTHAHSNKHTAHTQTHTSHARVLAPIPRAKHISFTRTPIHTPILPQASSLQAISLDIMTYNLGYRWFAKSHRMLNPITLPPNHTSTSAPSAAGLPVGISLDRKELIDTLPPVPADSRLQLATGDFFQPLPEVVHGADAVLMKFIM